MSLLDRVRHAAGDCTPEQARAACAEVYRTIAAAIAYSQDPENAGRTLADAANQLLNLNAAASLADVDAPSTPEHVTDLVEFEETS